MNLSALAITHQTTVLEEHLDEMGHMNVMWYTHFFDQGTWGLFSGLGMDLAYFENEHAGAFALEQHTRYLAELRLGDSVTVRSRILARNAKRLHFMHFMIQDGSGGLAATTELIGMHIDRRTRRSAPFPDYIADNIDEVLTQHKQLDWEAPVCGIMRP